MQKPKLTQEQIDHIINYVNERGFRRQRTQGAAFRDVDFVMGAASVFFFALELQDQIPASWIFNPLSGEPIFTERKDHAENSLS